MKKNKKPELVSLLFSVVGVVKQHVVCREDSFSFLQFKILGILEEKGTLTMKDLAQVLSITPPSVTAVVTSMVKGGVIERNYDTRDRRIIFLHATDLGEKMFLAQRKDIAGRIEAILSVLSPQEQRAFAAILEKILRIYTKQPK